MVGAVGAAFLVNYDRASMSPIGAYISVLSQSGISLSTACYTHQLVVTPRVCLLNPRVREYLVLQW
eukprot:684360-Rhodomonas_salina.1